MIDNLLERRRRLLRIISRARRYFFVSGLKVQCHLSQP